MVRTTTKILKSKLVVSTPETLIGCAIMTVNGVFVSVIVTLTVLHYEDIIIIVLNVIVIVTVYR